MRLENWRIDDDRVVGNVYNNPKFDDGEVVRTSPVKSINGDVLTTLNSTYILGVKGRGDYRIRREKARC